MQSNAAPPIAQIAPIFLSLGICSRCSLCGLTDRASVASRGASAVGLKSLGSSPDSITFLLHYAVIRPLQALVRQSDGTVQAHPLHISPGTWFTHFAA